MAPRMWLTAVAVIAACAGSVSAEEQRQRRARENPNAAPQGERAREQGQPRERAVPRTGEPRREEQARRDDQVRREAQVRRDEQIRRDEQVRSDEQARRSYGNRGYDNRGYNGRDGGRYDGRDGGRYDARNTYPRYGHAVPRRYSYPVRVIRPTIVRVIPYRPYVYRPSYRIGIYYGADGYYPYGYTPRGYFEPIPGRLYGGVRITGAPRDARVFADGYYVGIVNDFDGIFQHMNLEAGPHHIEIDLGYDAIEFDVYVRPGETTTFRADRY